VTAKRHRLGTELFGEAQPCDSPIAFGLRQPDQIGRLDIDHDPRRTECDGEPLARAYEAGAVASRTNANQDAFARRPRLRDALRGAVTIHRGVDPLGGLAQRQFAQRDQIAGAKEVVQCNARAFRNVDLTLAQALQQVFRG